MLWVCPPQISISVQGRVASLAIARLRRRANAGSRYSSTYFMSPPRDSSPSPEEARRAARSNVVLRPHPCVSARNLHVRERSHRRRLPAKARGTLAGRSPRSSRAPCEGPLLRRFGSVVPELRGTCSTDPSRTLGYSQRFAVTLSWSRREQPIGRAPVSGVAASLPSKADVDATASSLSFLD